TRTSRTRSTDTRSTRSMPHGSPTYSPGPGRSSSTRPKRRTTAISPGCTCVTAVTTPDTRTAAAATSSKRRRRMSLPPLRRRGRALAVLARGGAAHPRHRRAGPRRLEQQVEDRPVGREQQQRLVLAQNALHLLQLLEEDVELRVLAMGRVADAVRLGLGLALA